MSEYLLELFSEEIPARMQSRAAGDLRRLATEQLAVAQLSHGAIRAFVTPRRIAMVIEDLTGAQPDLTEERRGPRIGAPEAALEGFLKGAGIASITECEQRETDKGVFYIARIHRAGRPTREILPELMRAAILALPWPKSMRFPAAPFRWVRPLVSAISLLDGAVLPLELGAVPVGAVTSGHRFLAPGPIDVTGFADYAAKLRAAHVELDQAQRRRTIAAGLESVARRQGLKLKDDPGLLDEVTGLVEDPTVLAGRIDAAYMDLPAEVLTTSMRTHQKYFAVLDDAGKLAPLFLFVANNATRDGGAAIVAGNERVLRARLSDARFFWDLDRQAKLESRIPKLAERIFHAKIGSVLEKVDRIAILAEGIAPHISGADPARAARAALLAKADLSTGMVGEFPELQGIMGRYYALHDGETAAIAEAIAEHYSPLGPNDRCPTAPTSITVALADKIDTLVGFFSIGEKPTGSKDPYALRRAALGIIRIILENELRLPLLAIFDSAYRQNVDDIAFGRSGSVQYLWQLVDKYLPGGRGAFLDGNPLDLIYEHRLIDKEAGTIKIELLDFFADRLKVHLREQGVRHDLIAAIFALGGEDDFVRLLARVRALDSFLTSEDGANLLTAYRRAANIVRIEEGKDKRSYAEAPVPHLLEQGEERNLAERLAEVQQSSAAFLTTERFGDAMAALAKLRIPVDEFFAHVTVNCDNRDLRANRLRLLSQIRETLNRVADFSQIEG